MNAITPYVEVEEADEYVLNNVIDQEVWENADDSLKLIALRRATQAINNLKFKGCKTLLEQPNAFPRNEQTEVPDSIKQACVEIALMLIDGQDQNLAEEGLSTITDAYSTVRSTFDTNIRRDHIRAGIYSVAAWKLLLPHLVDPNALILRRG